MSRMYIRNLLGIFSSAALMALSPLPASGQQASPTTGVVEFALQPTVVQSLGLHLRLPQGASIQTRFLAGGQSRSIIQPDDGRWVMWIWNTVTSNAAVTTQNVLDGILLERRSKHELPPDLKRNERRFAIDVLERTDILEVGGLRGSRAYIGQPADPDYPVSGYTVFSTDPGRFVVFQFDTHPSSYQATKPVYESIVATVEFPNRVEFQEERAVTIEEGKAFIASISAEDLEAAMFEEPLFIRLFRPSLTGAPGDAEEIGYQKLSAYEGRLGDLDPRKPKASWNAAERELGYVVRMDARVLLGDFIADSRVMFFLSKDRVRETWSVLVEQKKWDQTLGKTAVSKMRRIVARDGPRMTVHTELPGKPMELQSYELLEEHYLSAVEMMLLPRLIARKSQADPSEVYDIAFYNFDMRRSNVTLRRERFELQAGGGWTSTTTPSEGEANWHSAYDAQGALLERTLYPEPVTVLKPTSRERLQRIWSKKNLPID